MISPLPGTDTLKRFQFGDDEKKYSIFILTGGEDYCKSYARSEDGWKREAGIGSGDGNVIYMDECGRREDLELGMQYRALGFTYVTNVLGYIHVHLHTHTMAQWKKGRDVEAWIQKYSPD